MLGSGFKLEEAVSREFDLECVREPGNSSGASMARPQTSRLVDDLSQALQVSSSGVRVIEGWLRDGHVEDGRRLLMEIAATLKTASRLVHEARAAALYARRGRVEVSAGLAGPVASGSRLAFVRSVPGWKNQHEGENQ
jgi:hypothetical protein